MSREIKFRAWDARAKAMFPIHRMDWNKISNDLTHFWGVDIHDKDSDHEGDVYYGGHPAKLTGKPGEPQVQRYYLMQYTGLKDRNGKEIYEGDIVKGKRLGANGEFKRFIGQVVFRGCAYQIDGVGQYKGLFGEELNRIYEVIGNVHQNPELLQQEAAADV